MDSARRALLAAADLLEYPRPGHLENLGPSARRVAAFAPAAAGPLETFVAAVLRSDAGALEEAYTRAFDLAPLASPYVGDQVFGAGPDRGALLGALHAMRREAGLPVATELPDHLAEVLRLAAALDDGPERRGLLRDGALPAARAMQRALAEARHAWADPLAAIVALLEALPLQPALPADAEASP